MSGGYFYFFCSFPKENMKRFGHHLFVSEPGAVILKYKVLSNKIIR